MAAERPRRERPAGAGLGAQRRRGALGRFLVVCFFVASVVVVLGIYFINNLFDEQGHLKRFNMEAEGQAAAVGEPLDVRPPGAGNQLRVFFTKNGQSLVSVALPTKGVSDPVERARQALEALLRGPSNPAYSSPIPEGTYLRAFYLRESEERNSMEAVIDVSREILNAPLGGVGAELLCTYALVNTALFNCESADSALILIDGRPVKGVLWSEVDLSGPLLPGAMILE
ncbi:MAG: GerMN domain-containing protein [Candidatus Sumerlaeota bacterium]|nr:GerMN domain-containing protein [Candidatus Sumerlaeota bacterium]